VDISKRILTAGPYEELLPEYRVAVKNDGTPSCKSAELIKKSKLEYLRNYVDEMKDGDLDEKGLNKDRLYEVLEKYYNAVTGL